MSILLDSVKRNKRRNYLPDPVTSSPLKFAVEPSRGSFKLFIAFILSIVGGALCAFSLNSLLIKKSIIDPPASTHVVTPADASIRAYQQASVIEQKHNDDKIQPNNDEIKFAGEAELPIAIEPPQKFEYRQQVTTNNQKYQAQYEEDTMINYNQRPSLSSSTSKKEILETNTSNERDKAPLVLGSTKELTNDQLAMLKRETGRNVQALPKLVDQKQAEKIDIASNQKDQRLVSALEAALKEVEYKRALSKPVSSQRLDPIEELSDDNLPSIDLLAASIKNRIPEFHILAHVYANTPTRRWLNVDGKELQQGDIIQGSLKIVEIRPRDIILDLDGVRFKVPAF